MSERIVRMDLESGEVAVIPLETALSELSGSAAALYSELAPRLREGETVRHPAGVAYRAACALGEQGMDQLPAAQAS